VNPALTGGRVSVFHDLGTSPPESLTTRP
jgi:hypothetical protein